jgi:DNA anti-recombination protein RmuC
LRLHLKYTEKHIHNRYADTNLVEEASAMANPEKTSAAGGGLGSLNELERLREILYGDQSRATAERLDQFEAHLDAQLKKNREEYKRLVDELKQALTERIEALTTEIGEKFNQEKEDRNALEAEMNQQVKKLDQKHTKQEKDLDEELRAIAASLEARKVSREELGAMLIEIGQRLQDGETA